MYRPRSAPESSPTKPIESVEVKREPKTTYELLWRKKSNKKHKTWEGDAIGHLERIRNGSSVLRAIVDRRPLGTFKLGTDDSEPNVGAILSSGNVEIEVGNILCCPKPLKQIKSNLVPNLNIISASSSSRSTNVTNLKSLPASNAPGNSSSVVVQPSKPPVKVPVKVSVDFQYKNPNSSTVVTAPSSKPKVGLMALDSPFQVPIKTSAPKIQSKISTAGLLPQLRSHQIEAVQFIKSALLGERHRLGYGCILADEMGLGKTLTSIALLLNLLAENHIQNALVVCPVSLIGNWKAEFKKWVPIHSRLGVLAIDHNGLGNGGIKNPAIAFFKDRQFKSHQILIVGYERVRKFSSELQAANKQFDLVICDEGHRLKSNSSATAEAIQSISGDKRLLLTGTPIQNDLREFWALADFVNPGCLGSEAKFARKYSQPIDFLTTKKEDSVSWEDLTSSQICERQELDTHNIDAIERAQEALSDLTEISEEFMLRRTSEVISKYIPVSKSEFIVFCRPSAAQVKKYQKVTGLASQMLEEQGDYGSKEGLQAISELKKIAAGDSDDCGGKLTMLSYLIDAISSTTDEKMVIVSGSTRVLDLCQNMLISKAKPWLRLDGSTSQDKRSSSVNLFNKTDAQRTFAFLLSSRSGGMGLNLIGGSRLVLLDCDWNPAIDTQVMARIHREGQKRACFIYRFLTTGTIDEKIFQRQLSKIRLSRNVLLDAAQGSNITKADFSKDILRDLFTLNFPTKCNTLDSLGTDVEVKGYSELETFNEPVLKLAISKASNVSCVFQKSKDIS